MLIWQLGQTTLSCYGNTKGKIFWWHQFVGIQRERRAFGDGLLECYLLSDFLNSKWILEYEDLEVGWTFIQSWIILEQFDNIN